VNKSYPAVFYPTLILKFLVKNPLPSSKHDVNRAKYKLGIRAKETDNTLTDWFDILNNQHFVKGFNLLIYFTLIISVLLLSPLWLVIFIWISISLGIFCFISGSENSDRSKKNIFDTEQLRSGKDSKNIICLPQREAALSRWLQNKILQPSGFSEAKEGVSEKDFYQALTRIFPNVSQGVKFDNPNYPYPYSADFILLHSSGLSIDIEIDEPYVGHTKEPHHCIDQGKDEMRNQFFTSNNWVVVRFSEKQVVKYPYRCCKVIAFIIAKVTGDYTFLSRLQNTPDLPVEPMWNIKQAKEWAKLDYRKTYLPIYKK
jgi:very-short-patch-repair endonuclease